MFSFLSVKWVDAEQNTSSLYFTILRTSLYIGPLELKTIQYGLPPNVSGRDSRHLNKQIIYNRHGEACQMSCKTYTFQTLLHS